MSRGVHSAALSLMPIAPSKSNSYCWDILYMVCRAGLDTPYLAKDHAGIGGLNLAQNRPQSDLMTGLSELGLVCASRALIVAHPRQAACIDDRANPYGRFGHRAAYRSRSADFCLTADRAGTQPRGRPFRPPVARPRRKNRLSNFPTPKDGIIGRPSLWIAEDFGCCASG